MMSHDRIVGEGSTITALSASTCQVAGKWETPLQRWRYDLDV